MGFISYSCVAFCVRFVFGSFLGGAAEKAKGKKSWGICQHCRTVLKTHSFFYSSLLPAPVFPFLLPFRSSSRLFCQSEFPLLHLIYLEQLESVSCWKIPAIYWSQNVYIFTLGVHVCFCVEFGKSSIVVTKVTNENTARNRNRNAVVGKVSKETLKTEIVPIASGSKLP